MNLLVIVMRIPSRRTRSVKIYDPISKSGEINALMRFIFSAEPSSL